MNAAWLGPPSESVATIRRASDRFLSAGEFGATPAGYGVLAPLKHRPVNTGAASDDGIFLADTTSGNRWPLSSTKTIVETATPAVDPADFFDIVGA